MLLKVFGISSLGSPKAFAKLGVLNISKTFPLHFAKRRLIFEGSRHRDVRDGMCLYWMRAITQALSYWADGNGSDDHITQLLLLLHSASGHGVRLSRVSFCMLALVRSPHLCLLLSLC